MPLQRPNAELRLLAPPEPAGSSLDELLGPVEIHRGDLHEPLDCQVPPAFEQTAAHLGVPLVLAAVAVIERSLAIGLLPRGANLRALDQHAAAATMQGRPSLDLANYARRLVAALQQRVAAPKSPGALTVPVRVADQMRARQVTPELDPRCIRNALQWELAAVASGLTVAEWALRDTLRDYAEAAASRHSVAAEKTAS
jgi:hypothetical protein